MRRGAFLSALGICALAALPALAASPSPPKISVNVDRQPIAAGEPFVLTINIETEGEGQPDVRLPRFGGLRVLQQSESHPASFHFSFGFGAGSTSVTREQSVYQFVLVADRPGQIKLDPVVVTVDNRQFRGESYMLEVSGRGSGRGGSSPAGGAMTPLPGADDSDTSPEPVSGAAAVGGGELAGAKIDPDFFIHAAVSKSQAYVGEMIVLDVYLYAARQMTDLDVVREPGTEGFWVENLLPANRRLTTEPVEVGGQAYDRALLRRIALFPIKPGALAIAPAIVELEMSPGGFFSRRRTVKRAAQPVKVEVLDLPRQGQPAGFEPANVGRYNFKAAVDRTEVKVGEPVTVTLTVRGEGNLRNAILPTVGEVPGFKTYAPETDVDVRTEGGQVTGTSSSRTLLIAKEPGEHVLPPVAWSYFDPQAREYRTAKSDAVKVAVRPGEAAAGGPVGAAPAEAAGKDPGQDRLNRQLRSILSRADLEVDRGGPLAARPWFLAIVVLVPLAYLAVALASRTRRRLVENRAKSRSKRADAEALRRLAELGRNADDKEASAFFALLEKSLTDFLEARLEEPIAGLTNAEARARLVARGFSPEQADLVGSELEGLDFARFARGAGADVERRRAIERVRSLIGDLARVRVRPPEKEAR